MTFSLIWRTDVHLADKGPRTRTDDYAAALLDKLKQVGEIARETSAVAVLDGGDFFHVKSPWKTSHDLLRRVMDVHRDYPCPVYACVGNHDCVYGDLAYLHQQPLGVLFTAGVFERLYDAHEFHHEADGVKVRVVGVPYHGDKYDYDRLKSIQKREGEFLVVVCHLYATPGPNTTMFGSEDVVGYDFIREEMAADVVLFGHWHKDQGVMQIAPGRYVINVGSLSRGSLSEEHADRIPCAVQMIFTKTGVKVIRHDLKVLPFSEAFDSFDRDRGQAVEQVREGFTEMLKSWLVQNDEGTGKSLEERVREMPIPPSVREKALLYLENTHK